MKSKKDLLIRALGAVFILALSLIYSVPALRSGTARVAQSLYSAAGVKGEFFSVDHVDATTVFLVGDAGDMTESVLASLRAAVRATPSSKALLYLGDNVYPNGIPTDTSTHAWEAARRNLLRQIEPLRAFTDKIYFIPGNHDWENHSEDGWNAAKRETRFIDDALGSGHSLPPNGCPGPVRVELVSGLQLVALDSSWWLHEHRKPSNSSDGCETFSPEGVLSSLDAMLASTPAGTETIIALHHPIIEPKADVAHPDCPTGPTCPSYIDMRDRLSAILAKHQPLLCASGHNHVLQVLRDQAGCRNYVVSGAASTTYQAPQELTASFSESALGFMVLSQRGKEPWMLDVIKTSRDDSLMPYSSRSVFHSIIQ